MMRTVNEALCASCKQITNAYDPFIGRICPKCCATHIVEISGFPLVESNKYLLTAPLIDHSNDIDRKGGIKNGERYKL